MARVHFSDKAAANLESLIGTYGLPANTPARVRRALKPLEQFPGLGARLQRGPAELRYTNGPWPWMVLIYLWLEERDEVFVVAIKDVRSAERL